jgi:hypothetical protein
MRSKNSDDALVEPRPDDSERDEADELVFPSEQEIIQLAREALSDLIVGHPIDERGAESVLSPTGLFPEERYPVLMSEAQIDCILAPFANRASKIDKQAIARDLVLVLVGYLRMEHQESKRMRERTQLHRAAQRLRRRCNPAIISSDKVRLLDSFISELEFASNIDDNERRRLIGFALGTMFQSSGFRQTERDLEEYFEELNRSVERVLDSDCWYIKEISAFERLAGIVLAGIYNQHLAASIGPIRYTRDACEDKVRGAYIDFVEAALRELNITNRGKPYSRKAIANAVTIARGRKSRRSRLTRKHARLHLIAG